MTNDWQGFMIFLFVLCSIVIAGGILAIFYLNEIIGAAVTIFGVGLFLWVYVYGHRT